MTGHFRGKINGTPFDLPLPPPTGIQLGRPLTPANLPGLAAGLAASYRHQWQSALRLAASQRNGPAIAQKLGDRVEAAMRAPFTQALEAVQRARLDVRLRRLESRPPPTTPGKLGDPA